jgi:hypothetical protein
MFNQLIELHKKEEQEDDEDKTIKMNFYFYKLIKLMIFQK